MPSVDSKVDADVGCWAGFATAGPGVLAKSPPVDRTRGSPVNPVAAFRLRRAGAVGAGAHGPPPWVGLAVGGFQPPPGRHARWVGRASPLGVGHGRRAGGHVAHYVRTVGLWGSAPPAHPLVVGPVVLRDTFLPDQHCLPVQCLWLGAAGARRHAVHVMHACPSRPSLLLHDTGLVLVHGVMQVAPSVGCSNMSCHDVATLGRGSRLIRPEANSPCLYPPHSLRASLSQLLRTELTDVLCGTRSLVGH